MRRVDDLLIGAGPAAAGVYAALSEAPSASRRSLLILGGGAAQQAPLARSKYGFPDARGAISEATFGLPAVRAFGSGGSTRLWHGGLFIPHADDMLIDATGVPADLTALLQSAAASPAMRHLPLAPALPFMANEVSNTDRGPWRTVLVPTHRPALITPLAIPLPPMHRFDDRAALDFKRSASNSWQTRVVGPEGIETIESERIILAAGCLATLALVARFTGRDAIGFTDHLHVFSGVVSRRALPSELRSRLGPQSSGLPNYSRRHIWKERIEAAGMDADVGLSFRAVANPEFPRSGRRYGRFLSSRGTGIAGKLALGIKHPVTAAEMLAYKFGVELPFDSYLVHATISPRSHAGRIIQGRANFAPDVEGIAHIATEAFARFVRHFGIEGTVGARAFDTNSIAQSVISGAQFAGGPEAIGPMMDAVDGLHIADTAAMRFTSVYNQCLLSMIVGYRSGQALAA